MERLERAVDGFTLFELVIAIALSAVVLLSAGNLLINFGKFSSNVVKSEASLMGTALGTFEEIVGKITIADKVTIPATTITPVPASSTDNSIEIRVHPASASYDPSHTGDTIYTYWRDGANLKSKSKVGTAAESAVRVVSADITLATFQKDSTLTNHIIVTLDAQTSSQTKEQLKTTAIMRSRSANLI